MDRCDSPPSAAWMEECYGFAGGGAACVADRRGTATLLYSLLLEAHVSRVEAAGDGFVGRSLDDGAAILEYGDQVLAGLQLQ